MSWLLMAFVGGASMWATTHTPPKVDILLIRFAGFAFIAAGLIGVGGVLGDILTWVMDAILTLVSTIAGVAFGTAAVWILAAGLGGAWILAMLPDKLFRFDAPDWLVISGIFIPGLLASVPGALGEGLRTTITWAGEAITTVMTRAVS